jgi:enamine deaminase RidA (YjgF/YER057c/UK114 family)
MKRRAVIPPALAKAAEAAGFSPAIRAGDFLFLTGATGSGPDGVMPQDAHTQAKNALSKVADILAEAGVDEASVVELTSYHTDIDADFAEVEAIVTRVFSPPLPAWTAVEIAKLRRPGARVEFRIVAHLV